MNLIVLIGLPGSGKTYLGTLLQAEMYQSIFLDDLSQNGGLEVLLQAADKEENIILSDVNLCYEDIRSQAELLFLQYFPNHEVEWVYFENDPEACFENVRRRDDGREVGDTIKMLTKVYKIPDNVEVRKVYHG